MEKYIAHPQRIRRKMNRIFDGMTFPSRKTATAIIMLAIRYCQKYLNSFLTDTSDFFTKTKLANVTELSAMTVAIPAPNPPNFKIKNTLKTAFTINTSYSSFTFQQPFFVEPMCSTFSFIFAICFKTARFDMPILSAIS